MPPTFVESRRSLPEKTMGPALDEHLRQRAMARNAPMLALMKHLPVPSELAPEIPPDLEAIALRALGLGWNKERLELVEPFADVAAFARALAEHLRA